MTFAASQTLAFGFMLAATCGKNVAGAGQAVLMGNYAQSTRTIPFKLAHKHGYH